MQRLKLISRSPADTAALGETLGKNLSEPVVLLLSGDLGAGKTCFVQGLAKGLGVPASEPVTSPTYTLMNHHHGRLDLFHLDLYRLNSADELNDLGVEEYLDGAGVVVVEWADRIPEFKPDGLVIAIDHDGEESRSLTVHARGGVAAALLDRLAHLWQERGGACD